MTDDDQRSAPDAIDVSWRERFEPVAVRITPVTDRSHPRGVLGWRCVSCGLVLAGPNLVSCPRACPHCA
jgi:hypothetical protein